MHANPRLSPRLAALQPTLIGALHRALTIACETGRTSGPEFDQVSELIRRRDDLILDESDLTVECVGQIMGGN